MIASGLSSQLFLSLSAFKNTNDFLNGIVFSFAAKASTCCDLSDVIRQRVLFEDWGVVFWYAGIDKRSTVCHCDIATAS
jgi:hypothetical protein